MENMISQLFRSLPKFVYVGGTSGFKTDKNLRYIADTCNSALTTGIDDITGFRRHGKP